VESLICSIIRPRGFVLISLRIRMMDVLADENSWYYDIITARWWWIRRVALWEVTPGEDTNHDICFLRWDWWSCTRRLPYLPASWSSLIIAAALWHLPQRVLFSSSAGNCSSLFSRSLTLGSQLVRRAMGRRGALVNTALAACDGFSLWVYQGNARQVAIQR